MQDGGLVQRLTCRGESTGARLLHLSSILLLSPPYPPHLASALFSNSIMLVKMRKNIDHNGVTPAKAIERRVTSPLPPVDPIETRASPPHKVISPQQLGCRLPTPKARSQSNDGYHHCGERH